MKTKSLLRPTLSSLLVSIFLMVLLFLALFAEVFDSNAPEVDLAQIYANPVPISDLQQLRTVRIANKQGSFLLENTHPDGSLIGPWQMVEPQSLKVKEDVVPRILEALGMIRVRNFHRLEPINLTSFSLDNPTLTLSLTTRKERMIEIKMGLINPIDNSAYMGLSTQNQIYQIDPIEMALESYDLAQLVESRVLALNASSLASVEIYTMKGLELKLLKKDEGWVDQNSEAISTAKVTKFFERLEEIKSFSIVDNLNADQRLFMEKAMASPVYSMKLITAQGVRTYVVGEVKGNIPGMQIPRSSYYALSSEDRKSFVLLDKDEIRIFSTKSMELRL